MKMIILCIIAGMIFLAFVGVWQKFQQGRRGRRDRWSNLSHNTAYQGKIISIAPIPRPGDDPRRTLMTAPPSYNEAMNQSQNYPPGGAVMQPGQIQGAAPAYQAEPDPNNTYQMTPPNMPYANPTQS